MARRRREAANISASKKTYDCCDTVRQFYPSDMASLASPTSRVGKTCYENVWTTTGFCDMKNLPRNLSRHARSKNNLQNQNCFENFWKRNFTDEVPCGPKTLAQQTCPRETRTKTCYFSAGFWLTLISHLQEVGSRGWVLWETTTLKAAVNVTDLSCQQQDPMPLFINISFYFNKSYQHWIL